MSKKVNYDIVAPFYDRLAKLIYGNAIVDAQKFLVEGIAANSSILIVGGGTGALLEEIAKKHATGISITYVDMSAKMIKLSKRRNYGNNDVLFIPKPIQDAELLTKFDIVITPFFLDNFSNTNAAVVFDKIHNHLFQKGLWLFADFILLTTDPVWKKLLVKIMYLFFKMLCNIETLRLPNMKALFDKKGYALVCEKKFFSNFICAAYYKKER